MTTHIGELVYKLVDGNIEEFERVLKGKNVARIIFSLMMNGGNTFSIACGLLSINREFDHKRNDYHLDADIFFIDKDELCINEGVLKKIREIATKANDKKEARNCPAFYTPDAVKDALDFLKRELIYQYKKHQEAQARAVI